MINMNIKLDTQSLRFMSLFEKHTKAMVKDCIYSDEKVIFIVNEGFAGMAIGRNGSNVKKLENMINKKIEIVEFSKDPIKFLTNLMRPFDVKNAYISEKSNGEKILYFSINRSGPLLSSKIKKANRLVSRYFKGLKLEMS